MCSQKLLFYTTCRKSKGAHGLLLPSSFTEEESKMMYLSQQYLKNKFTILMNFMSETNQIYVHLI